MDRTNNINHCQKILFISKNTNLSRAGLLHGRGAATLDLAVLGFLDALGKELLVLSLSLGSALKTLSLGQLLLAFATKSDGGNQTLDLGSLGVGLLVGVGRLNGATDNVLADIVFLAQVKEFTDVVSTLGTQTLGDGGVGQTGNILLALLNDDQVHDSQVGLDDTTANGLALALTGAARAVARVALAQQQADTVGQKDTLLHGETLLVVTTGNAENVTLEFVTERIADDFLGHAFVVERTTSNIVSLFSFTINAIPKKTYRRRSSSISISF